MDRYRRLAKLVPAAFDTDVDVTLRLFASLRERAGAADVVERGLPSPLDMAGLKRELERRHPEWGSLAHVRGAIGSAYAEESAAVGDGSEIALLPPVSGGGSDKGKGERAPVSRDDLECGVFELCAEPLDVASAYARVRHPACGAIAVFTGTTRDRNRGRTVERLEYEAFAAMTGAEMSRIFTRCREKFASGQSDEPGPALRMLCQHRLGIVLVGEPSVVIAVASRHRDRAFAACRFLIDELKASMPIWKKEFYPDGEHWIGDRS